MTATDSINDTQQEVPRSNNEFTSMFFIFFLFLGIINNFVTFVISSNVLRIYEGDENL